MARRKIKLQTGDVFEIPLEEGFVAFGHILPWNLVGFYAIRSSHRPSIEDITGSEVAFRTVCMTDAIEDGRWPVLGNAPAPAPMNEPIRFWRSTAPGFVFMMEWVPNPCPGEKRVRETEIVGVEKKVIWNSLAIVARLKCFFCGEPYPLVEIG